MVSSCTWDWLTWSPAVPETGGIVSSCTWDLKMASRVFTYTWDCEQDIQFYLRWWAGYPTLPEIGGGRAGVSMRVVDYSTHSKLSRLNKLMFDTKVLKGPFVYFTKFDHKPYRDHGLKIWILYKSWPYISSDISKIKRVRVVQATVRFWWTTRHRSCLPFLFLFKIFAGSFLDTTNKCYKRSMESYTSMLRTDGPKRPTNRHECS